MKLSNKVALVTGGLKGIGRATVMELATQGADIALNYRNAERRQAEQLSLRPIVPSVKPVPVAAHPVQRSRAQVLLPV